MNLTGLWIGYPFVQHNNECVLLEETHLWHMEQWDSLIIIDMQLESDDCTERYHAEMLPSQTVFLLANSTARFLTADHFVIQKWTSQMVNGEPMLCDMVFSRPGLAELMLEEVVATSTNLSANEYP